MKKRSLLQKVTALGVASMMMLSGCGNAASPSTTDTTKENAAATESTESATAAGDAEATADRSTWPTLTVAVQMNEKGEYSSNNYAINYIEEHMQVNLEFVQLPSADAETKLNLMLSSGEYPDVISFGLSKQKMVKFGQDGIFIPINEYYEKYGNNMKQLFDKRPQYESLSYAPDGNMYGFVTVSECYHCQAYPKLWYNSEWMDSLGLKAPTTTEELKEVLIAVRDSDYNGNGAKDEIPLTGSPDWDCQLQWFLLNSFIPCDKDTLSYATADGKVEFACDKDDFKQGLAYLNDLYNEGLIDPTTFSQTSDQMQQVIRSDQKLVFGYTADHYAMGVDLDDRHMNEVITAMVPVKGPSGAQYQLHKDYVDMTSGFSWFITDKCQDPGLAFQVGDFLMGEEASMVQMYGEEGKYWGYLDQPQPSIIEGTEATIWCQAKFTSNEETEYQQNSFWTNLVNQLAEFRATTQPLPDDMYASSAYEARLFEETNKVIDYFYPYYLPRNVYLENDAEEFNSIQTSLREYVKTSVAQFITGELNLDKDWDTYVSSLDKYGVDKYISLYQTYFDDYNASK